MNLKILLPFQTFADKTGLSRIVAETSEGAFGILPHRLDCVAALSAGILTYQQEGEDEAYVAIDEGVLVKTGLNVLISVRNAIGGVDIDQLRSKMEMEFLKFDKQEQNLRSVMAKIQSDFIHRLVEYHRE